MLIKQNGIRNAVMLTAAPTGTISMVHGTSTGIEPIFAPMYKRRYREGNTWRETVVLDPLFKEALERDQDASHIVGAYDITPEQHMAVQAVCQRYIDNAVSKTINLPNKSDSKEIAKMALNFAPYLKGLTVYRAGSKGMEPLEAIPLTPENIQMAKDLISKEKAESEMAVEMCKVGGECGA
jgi:ribonucleoside-diphosphate reductase alpha chain